MSSRKAFNDVKVRPPKKKKNAKKGGLQVVEVATVKEFCKDKIEEAFWDNVPEAVKELPDPHMTRFAIFVTLAGLATFIFFTVIQIAKAQNFTFISLDKGAGVCTIRTSPCKCKSETGVCTNDEYEPSDCGCCPVPKGVTSPVPFVGTITGYWQGDSSFAYDESAYLLTLSNFNGNDKEYTAMMGSFADNLEKFSLIGNNKSAAYNAALWTSFSATYSTCTRDDDKCSGKMCTKVSNGKECQTKNKRQQTLRLSGYTEFVFEPAAAYGGFVGKYGLCSTMDSIFASVSLGKGLDYDKSSKYFTFSYDAKYFGIGAPDDDFDDSDDTFYNKSNINYTKTPTKAPTLSPTISSIIPSVAPTIAPTTSSPTPGPTTHHINTREHGPLTCYNLVENFDFGLGTNSDGLVTFGFDIDSFMTAYAVNIGILPYDALVTIEPDVDDAFVNTNSTNTSPNLETFLKYDPKYPGMDPLICINSTLNSNKPLCTLSFKSNPRSTSQGLGLPILHNAGNTYYNYKGPPNSNYTCPPCGSPYDSSSYADQILRQYCNQFIFYVGLAVFNNVSDLLDFSDKFDSNYEAINDAGFDASYWAVNGENNIFNESKYYFVKDEYSANCVTYNDGTIYNSTECFPAGYINASLDFCDHSCIVVALQTLSLFNDVGRVVNQYFSQVGKINCANGIYNLAAFGDDAGLVATPPVTLTENYYACRNAPQDTFLDSIGIANGNTAILFPIAVTLLLPFVYVYFRLIGYNPPKKEYTNDEKQILLDGFLVHILRIRDGKTRSFKKDSLAVKLVEEFRKADNIPSGYPDSDDEDNFDDDDDGTGNNTNGDDDYGDSEKGKKTNIKSSRSNSSSTNNSNKITSSKSGSSLAAVKGLESDGIEMTSNPMMSQSRTRTAATTTTTATTATQASNLRSLTGHAPPATKSSNNANKDKTATSTTTSITRPKTAGKRSQGNQNSNDKADSDGET